MVEVVYGEYVFTMRNLFTVMDFKEAIVPKRWDRIRKLKLELECPNRRMEVAFEREMNDLRLMRGTLAETAWGV